MLKRFRFLFLAVAFLSLLFYFSGGCIHSLPSNMFPGKKKEKKQPEDTFVSETEDGKPKLIGDYVTIGNYHPVVVHGFGLVVDLPGTGGDDFNTPHYQWVYNDMIRKTVRYPRAILARPETAVVEIIGRMPPGIQNGDRFDVQVMCPHDTDTKSLRGGRLMPTKLSEMASLGGTMEEGVTRAIVEGPIMVDDPTATEASNPSGLKKGTILSGAVVKAESRKLSLILKERSFYVTNQITKAINYRFSALPGTRNKIAEPQTDELIVLEIHPSYMDDISRYVRVIQSIACYETQVQQIKRIERLKEELLDPETSQNAAFQLEAIGKPGIEALQQALRSNNKEVRFHAATSLAYIGDDTPAKELAEIARTDPAFRIYALNALSVMKNNLEAEMRLQELLHEPSAETRYGAFRALKNRNPLDQTIRGEILGGQFSYHGISSHAVPIVHITSQRFPEVVLFGTDIYLKQPFALDAGATIYVNGQVPGTVVVSKLVTLGIDEKRTVSNRLDEIIRAVVDMGGTYPDVVQMLKQAETQQRLSCQLKIDCIPEANRTYRRSSNDEDWAPEEEKKTKSFWDRMNPRTIFAPNPGEKSSDYMGTVNTSSRD